MGEKRVKPYVPYEKLNKKQRRALCLKKRGDWGAISPVTRKPANPRAYNRRDSARRLRDLEQ